MKSLTAVLLLVAIPTMAQTPPEPTTAQVVLDAPDTARVGDLIRFDASESTADSYKWIHPETKDFLTYDDGKHAVFSARVRGERVRPRPGDRNDPSRHSDSPRRWQ